MSREITRSWTTAPLPSVIGVTTASNHFTGPDDIFIEYLKTAGAASSGPCQCFLRRLSHLSFEEPRERTIQQFAGIRNFHEVEPHGVDVEEASLEIDNLDAVASAIDNSSIQFLCLSQGFFVVPALGDVDDRARKSDNRSLFVSIDRPARVKPTVAAIAMAHPVFVVERGTRSADVSVDATKKAGRVVGVHEFLPVVEMIADLVIGEAEDLLDQRIHVDFAGLQVPVPDTNAAGDCRTPVEIVSGHDVRAGALTLTWPRQSHRPERRRRKAWSVAGYKRHAKIPDQPIAVAGDEDDGSVPIPIAQAFAKFKTTETGQPHVGNHTIHGDVLRFKFLGRRKQSHLMAHRSKKPGKGGTDIVIVVDNGKGQGLGWGHPARISYVILKPCDT